MTDEQTIWFGEPPTPESLNQLLQNDAVGYMDMAFIEVGPAHLAAKLPLGPRTRQSFGLLHGGVSCVVAETMGSVMGNYVLDRERQFAVGLEINATHLNSAAGDGFVIATTRPVKLGGSVQTTETRLVDDRGRDICIARLTTIVRDRR